MIEINSPLDEVTDFDYSKKNNDNSFATNLLITKPSNDFVLCRDGYGKPTAIYGRDIWDFNPIRLSGKKCPLLNFNFVYETDEVHMSKLISEMKWLLFCIIYKSNIGKTGRPSPVTIYNYYYVLKKIIKFAVELSQNIFDKENLCIMDILTSEKNLNGYLKTITPPSIILSNALISILVKIGPKQLGYDVIYTRKDIDCGYKQHPVIPAQLYLHYMNAFTAEVAYLKANLTRIEHFLAEFSDQAYGTTHKTQSTHFNIKEDQYRPTFTQAVKKHGLEILLYDVKKKAQLGKKLRQIQFTLKCIIHFYTGMRDQEVLRLPYNCIHTRELREEIKDNHGKVIVPHANINLISEEIHDNKITNDTAKIINLDSTTTKYTGYRKKDSWYAPEIVMDAVNLLKKIATGLCHVRGLNPSDCCLFYNVSTLFYHKKLDRFDVSDFSGQKMKRYPDWYYNAVISAHDFELLKASDPARDFVNEKIPSSNKVKFQVGGVWPLTSHQFRRSLAFYASNAGFVSLPTLQRQFKHLSREITKYYSRNNENIASIFGHYDKKTGTFKIPNSHIIFECHAVAPSSVTNKIIDDIISAEGEIYGKSGRAISRKALAAGVFDGDTRIELFRSETEHQVRSGALSYRRTLLGGCTNHEFCECRILGEFSGCIGSDCAVIIAENIEREIIETQNRMMQYQPEDGEYQVLEYDLNALLKFKEYRVDTREVSDEQ